MDPPVTTSADALRKMDLPASGLVGDTLSLPSYREYPAHRPFSTTLVHHFPSAPAFRASSPCKAFPETNSTAILSALRTLQEKIQKLEKEKGHLRMYVHDAGKDVKNTYTQSDTDMNKANCNQVLIKHLATAESRCLTLEKQLDQTRKMLRSAKTDRTNIFHQVEETSRSADRSRVLERLEKIDLLEQEYLRLTQTQNDAERKIRELEIKLQEEEHQRKLVENKADLLQAGLETNRMLLRSVSPHRKSKHKELSPKVKKPSLQRSVGLSTEPHYKFRLRDAPFVAGTSVGSSHSVRANVQAVLSLLKCHQPQLCNRRVLSHKSHGSQSRSSSSSSSPSDEDGLCDLLHGLQEELRLMSLEQEELLRKVERSVSEQERKELQLEQERLLLKMEGKGDQINMLYKHKSQVRNLLKESNDLRVRKEVGATRKYSSRDRSPGAAKLPPGERSKRNLCLLRDMRALQKSLQS